MDITQIYAIAVATLFSIFIILTCRPFICFLWEQVSHHFLSYLSYLYLVRRHHYIGPWTSAVILTQLLYITLNIFCLTFQVSTISEAATRAGTLSLINFLLPFAGSHLSFLADITSTPLRIYRLVHRSTGLMSFFLALFHVLVSVTNGSFSLRVPKNLFGLVVCFLPSSVVGYLTIYRLRYPCAFLYFSLTLLYGGFRTKYSFVSIRH